MKKTLLTALTIISINAFSQDVKGSLTIGFGYSKPLGEFAANDVNSTTTKLYATSGILAEIGYNYHINDKFGLSLDYRFTANDRDITPIVNEYKKTTTVNSYSNGSYTGAGFFIGGFYKLPLNNKFSLDFKLAAGYIGITSHDFKIETTTSTLTKKAMVTGALAIDLGVKLKIKLGTTNRFYSYVGIDELIANPNVKDEESYSSESGNTYKSSYDYIYNNTNLTFGIGYNFFK